MGTHIKINEPPQSQNMCQGCQGHCCSLTVELTSYDIARIVVEKGRDPKNFVKYTDADENDYSFKALGKRVKLILGHKKDGYCTFFDSKKTLKCSIDDSKPGICLAYPMDLHNGKSMLRTNVVCPLENLKKADFVKMSTAALEDCRWEWERHKEMLEDWNSFARGHENPEEFLRFAFREMQLETSPWGAIYRKIRRKVFRLVKK